MSTLIRFLQFLCVAVGFFIASYFFPLPASPNAGVLAGFITAGSIFSVLVYLPFKYLLKC